MKSFSVYLETAKRASSSEYYVDYELLKGGLEAFSRRRAALGTVLNDENDNTFVTAEDLNLADRAVSVPPEEARKIVNVLSLSSIFAPEKATATDYVSFGYFEYKEKEKEEGRQIHAVDALSQLSTVERGEFCDMLDKEVEKAAAHYSSQLAFLAKSIDGLVSNNPKDKRMDDITELVSPETIGVELLEVLAYLVVNLITLRQILIRYDACARGYSGMPLSQWYLKRREGSTGCYLTDLFHLDAINNLRDSYEEYLITHLLTTNHKGVNYSRSDVMKQYDQFLALLNKTTESVQKVVGGHISKKDRLISLFLQGSKGLSMEPSFLQMKGKHLKKEMHVLAEWRETQKIIPPEHEEKDFEKMDPENVVPLILNLLSSFLYAMNSYIVEPSSAYYVNALGAPDALAGILVGAMPAAALLSAVGYSVWSTYTFRQPILFAGTLMFVGNILYASAYAHQSISMCLIGRMLTGLGGPKVINRRYMADATPFSFRTMASAAFAMSTALGAALGPGTAVILDMFEFQFTLPFLGVQYFNGMTGPGYLMAVLWLIFTLTMALIFKEPTRTGLEELKQREAAKAKEKPPSSSSLINVQSMESDSETYTYAGKSITCYQEEIPETRSSLDSMLVADGSRDSDSVNSSTQMEHANINYTTSKSSSSKSGCWQHMTRAVVVCMTLIFLKRVALESVMGSTSIVTKNRYGWTIKQVGTLHFVNGLLVVPASIVGGWLSQFYQDRFLAMWLLGSAMTGMLMLIDFSDFVPSDAESFNEGSYWAVGPYRYVAGSLIAFSSVEACESFISSLMSKVIPSALASGTFNSGLLATLIGTGGRAMGDLYIATAAFIDLRNILNLLVIPAACYMGVSIGLIYKNYDLLAV
eukprot:CAMPEP_0198306292 /NCGR_PEP_ID=MMETSP1449-20131203/58340_1 /TAXON_ID=420275 /ORGANISM="Attheya septentrionalis, Strain CCMP2084" /LENGTH=869 /DNA_ID=CAMNT_0044008843 /DNA_START=120 /DNA_END=2729 /DNA_ORIENTATION=-